jgi:hypothetical protein
MLKEPQQNNSKRFLILYPCPSYWRGGMGLGRMGYHFYLPKELAYQN